MWELICVELYKLKKKKYFLLVFGFNCISLLYGAGIMLNWSWISFNGKFDVIQYMGAIWQLLFLIGLPLIFFMYIGASVLGGEIAEGQILLEIKRVADRKKLVVSKVGAVFVLILFYFVTNILSSVISYTVFVRRTQYTTGAWAIFNQDNINLIVVCIFGCIYIVFSVFTVMYLSIKRGAVVSTIIGAALYAAFSLLTRIPGIRMCVPGYFALFPDSNFGVGSIVQQFIWCFLVLYVTLYFMRRKIGSVDF